MQNNSKLNRRNFLKKTFGAATVTSFFPSIISSSVWSAEENVLPGNRITLGIIGVGKQGAGLLRGFLNTPGFHVVAVCDVDELKLNKAKERVEDFYADKRPDSTYKGCATYRDFREILARNDIDAVVITTPDHWHAIPVIMAARACKDIYCEKPLSLTNGMKEFFKPAVCSVQIVNSGWPANWFGTVISGNYKVSVSVYEPDLSPILLFVNYRENKNLLNSIGICGWAPLPRDRIIRSWHRLSVIMAGHTGEIILITPAAV